MQWPDRLWIVQFGDGTLEVRDGLSDGDLAELAGDPACELREFASVAPVSMRPEIRLTAVTNGDQPTLELDGGDDPGVDKSVS